MIEKLFGFIEYRVTINFVELVEVNVLTFLFKERQIRGLFVAFKPYEIAKLKFIDNGHKIGPYYCFFVNFFLFDRKSENLW